MALIPAGAQIKERAKWGFHDTSEFVDYGEFFQTPVERNAYTRGFVNGLLASVFLRVDDKTKLQVCIAGMSGDHQLTAIIQKYINDHPKDWQLPLAEVGFRAIADACNFGSPPTKQ